SSTISWNDLKDPNIQMKPGGIGLGNLHRTGNNFKPHSEIADSEGGPGKMKRNVHQTHAFKTAIATLGKKQPRVPSRDRTRKEIARGTSWGTTSLSKTPFWNTKDEFKPLSNSQSPQQPPQQQQVINDLESQTQPETTRGLEEPIPIIQIKLSFAPGVTSTLVVFEEDSPKHIVAEFCRKHDLTMTQKAQNSFVDTLTKLKQAKLNSLSKN
ncbi:hypothetical protein K501DRAFT_137026, partial [Backusella circina FSU 941]